MLVLTLFDDASKLLTHFPEEYQTTHLKMKMVSVIRVTAKFHRKSATLCNPHFIITGNLSVSAFVSQFVCVRSPSMHSRLNIPIYGLLIFIALICNIECHGNFSLWREGDSNRTCETGKVRCQDKCVQLSWICDRDNDCVDKSDEIGCPSKVRVLWNMTVQNVGKSVQSSLLWLQQQRKLTVGWGKDTNKVVATLLLSNPDSSNEVAIRDLQCDLLRRIRRNRTAPLSGIEMAHYSHALLAACLNPKNFFTIDLVEGMEKELNSTSYVDPFVALAVCNADGQVPRAKISELLRKLKIERGASQLLALKCIHDKRKYILEEEIRKLRMENPFIAFEDRNSTLNRLIHSQTNGSYGDVYTTAMALQALLSSEVEDLPLKPILDSFNYILSENLNELPDPIASAYLLLPLFSGKTLLDFGRVNCSLLPFEGRNISTGQKPCADGGNCIPFTTLCDDYEDEKKDRIFMRQQIEYFPRVSSARQRALNWLLSQRRINWGWEDDTNRAIVALYLVNTERFALGDRDNELMAKQLQIQLSELLLKDGLDSVPAHQLALFVHALLAICVNPRDFQGYNLVEALKQKIDKSDSLNPFLILALCNANETLSQTHIMELAGVIKQPNGPETTDSQAYAVMGLFCIKRLIGNLSDTVSLNRENDTLRTDHLLNHSLATVSANRTFEISMDNVTSIFKDLQHKNGGFGSVYTTALVLQALITSESMDDSWNLTKGIEYLLSHQRGDGSFGNILSTYLVLPLLHARTLYDLGASSCPSTQYRYSTVKEEFDSIKSPKQRVQYSIWLGIRKDVFFSISLMVPVNKTFYDVMRLAVEFDPRYRFEYFSYSWGKYVYSIFGVMNDPEARNYWQIYQVEGENTKFIEKAPEDIIPGNNEWYVYWYRNKNHN